MENAKNLIRTSPSPNCYVCGVIGNPLYRDLQDNLFGAHGKWNIKKCRNQNCGLLWLDPMPLDEDIEKAYKTYYTHSNKNERSRKFGFLSLLKLSIRSLMLFISRFTGHRRALRYIQFMTLEGSKPGRLLDIGCGAGVFLTRMKQLGWLVEGVDFDSHAINRAKASGLDVHCGDLESMGYSDNCFDAITMNHVIEHVYDPIELLKECHRVLKPGGRLVVVTPNTLSMGHERFGPAWRGLEPPRHIHIFSPNNLRICAERAGFNEIKTSTTAANAAIILAGSLMVKMISRNNVSLGKHQGWHSLYALLIQYQEYFTLLKNSNCGEEVLLIATKISNNASCDDS